MVGLRRNCFCEALAAITKLKSEAEQSFSEILSGILNFLPKSHNALNSINQSSTMSAQDTVAANAAPQETYGRLFLRFLRFGALAWGGPVAQIAMIRQELIEDEKWISRERFNRVLAVYQILPGPGSARLAALSWLIRKASGYFLCDI